MARIGDRNISGLMKTLEILTTSATRGLKPSINLSLKEKIYKDLENISQGKTLIFISHRLASTRFCDKIMLLDGGKIKEIGSHEELSAKNGLYKQMYESQRKYYKEEDDEK